MKLQFGDSGYAQTRPGGVWQGPGGWTLSALLGAFYLLAIVVFMSAHFGLDALAKRGEPNGRLAGRMLIAAVLVNAALVLGFLRLADMAHVQPRLAMIGLPLFLIVESYVKKLRAHRERRLPLWAGFAGSVGGALAAGFALMRGLPLH